jgi:hypothetical protein
MGQGKPARKRPVGRPKTRPDDYSQRSVWLPDALHFEVRQTLMMPKGKDYEFSRLVEHLLRQWLKAGGKLPVE